MSKSRLAKTIFQSGPDDDLIVKDVYESDSSEVVNSYDKTEPEAIDVLDTINGTADDDSQQQEEDNSNNENNEESSNENSNESPVDELGSGLEDILDRYGNADENIADALRQMSEEGRNKLLPTDQEIEDIYYSVGDKEGSFNPSFPIKDAKNLASIINSICNNSYGLNINDNGALAALLGALSNMASLMGLPGVLSAVQGCLNPSVLMNGALLGINSSLKRGDVSVFNDVATLPIANQLRYRNPNITNQVIENMRRPSRLQEQGLSNFYQTTRNSLNIVNPNWNTTSRGSGQVFNGYEVSKNPFFLDTVRANVVSKPMNIFASPDASYGNFVDLETADLNNPYVFESIYGRNLSVGQKTKIINDWRNDQSRLTGYNQRKNDAYLLLMQGQKQDTVLDSLRKDFPYLAIGENKTRAIGNFHGSNYLMTK